MDLSVVIVNWNVRELLRKALLSLRQHPARRYSMEVWVVDNDSKDNSAQMVAKEFPEVKLIASEKNLGFAAGNNSALKQAQGAVLLCLNPDTEMHEGTLDFIVDKFKEYPRLGALGVKLLNTDGSLQPSCKGFPNLDTIFWNALSLDVLFPKSKVFGRYNMTWFKHDSEMEVDQPMGAALAVRRETMEQVGMYDERYFMYFDEVDWCYRIKQSGWQIKFFPQVQVTHHWAKSTSQALGRMNKQWYRSFAKYLEKNYRYPKWLIWFCLSSMVWIKLLIICLMVLLILKSVIFFIS